jgi:isoleucyl-tRNA synthetase
MSDYKDTLNLPKTAFPMKANLKVNEPLMVERWERERIYERMVERNKGKTPFILHDGPPYANGDIHFGHILNKVLKDIVIKYKNMSGFFAEFIPGWDCHGLPIELQVEKEIGKGKDVLKVRRACRDYALKYVDIQRREFTRLGVLGLWKEPYLTLNPRYEAVVVREFGKFVKGGYVYKGKKPVFWCTSCQTALAEAEVEYRDHSSPSIYVKFRLGDEGLKRLSPDGVPVYAVIWTTTPWTIPSNLAIALNPRFRYLLVDVGGERWLMADSLLESAMKEMGVSSYKVYREVLPSEIEMLEFRHPLIDRASLAILGEHVTMDAGTGCVHTAPGHGREDYEIGQKYNLPVFAPVDARGCFTDEVGLPYLKGVSVWDANRIVNEKLKETDALVWEGKVLHSYPHCWRCKNPVVFRATEQWFISIEHNDLRKKALDIIDKVEWIPKWGRDRIYGMVEARPDWCISRQRSWGVPIVSLICRSCGDEVVSPEIAERAALIFEEKGSDAWFTDPTDEFVPKGFVCGRCGGVSFDKGRNIIDVWFESGVSYAAVIEGREGSYVPVDLYLEGSDQHRGWFHSALLSSVATRGISPYKSCLTHGFVVDNEGRKYSKSAGNYIPPEKVIDTYGAEILRLWVAAEDYRNDIKVSEEIVRRLTEAYRKIRNTARFILGNLYDFDPKASMLDYSKLRGLDRWILHKAELFKRRCLKAYESYEYHVIYHALNEFCVVDLSSFYLDILKDRLYCEGASSLERRSAQTAIYHVLDTMVRIMAPILSFMADEIWLAMPAYDGKEESVFLLPMPDLNDNWINGELGAKWERFLEFRKVVLKALELARANGMIGNSLEARVVIETSKEIREFLNSLGENISDLFIVSQCEFGVADGEYSSSLDGDELFKVAVQKANGKKCSRCWKFFAEETSPSLEICPRCAAVIKGA